MADNVTWEPTGIDPEVEAKLDAMLAQTAAGDSDTEADDTEADDESGAVSDGTPEVDDGDADQGLDSDDETDDSLDDDTPDGDEDDEAPAGADSDSEQLTPREQALLEQRNEARKVAAQLAANQEEARIAWETRQADARADDALKRFLTSLEDMDPADAERTKLELVVDYAARLQQKQLADAQQAQTTNHRQLAHTFLAEGNRLVHNPQTNRWDAVHDDALKLTEGEAKVLSHFKGSPAEMLAAAEDMIADRKSRSAAQTAAARQARAKQRRDSGADSTAGAGGRGTVPAQAPIEKGDIDTLLDRTNAAAPWLFSGKAKVPAQRSNLNRR